MTYRIKHGSFSSRIHIYIHNDIREGNEKFIGHIHFFLLLVDLFIQYLFFVIIATQICLKKNYDSICWIMRNPFYSSVFFSFQIEENSRALAYLGHKFGSTSSLDSNTTTSVGDAKAEKWKQGARKTLLQWVTNALPKYVISNNIFDFGNTVHSLSTSRVFYVQFF